MNFIPLKNVVENLDSGSRPRGGVSVNNNGVPSLGGEHLGNDGGFRFKKLKCISNDYFQSMKKGKINKNDILIVKDGATTGKTSFVRSDFKFSKAAVNEHVFRLTPNSNLIDPKFLFYFLFSPYGNAQLLKDFRGATIGGITRNILDVVKVPEIPKKYQTRIAKILDKADGLWQKRKESIKLLDDFLRSTFLEMFGDPKVYNKNRKTDNLGNIATIVMGQSPPGVSYNKNGNGAPLLNGPAEFGEKYPIEKQWTDQPKKYSKKGDILFCVRGATAGRMNWSDKDYCIGRGLAAIRKKSRISNSFIYSFLEFMYPHFQNTSDGSTFINISSDILNKLKIPIPEKREEQKFSFIYNQVEKLKIKYKESEKELDNLFGSLMQRAFRGEL